MKYFIFSLSAIFSIFIIATSCSEDLPIAANFTETAVVYGLLDQSEEIHYIKINRAFIGPGDANQIAKVPDSCYFKNVEAKIVETAGLKRTWVLRDTMVENKDTDGIFYAPEQKLYYFSTKNQAALNPDSEYKLTVTIDKGLSSEFVISGKTELITGVGMFGNNIIFPSNPNLNLAPDNSGNYASKSFDISSGNSQIINCQFDITVEEFTSNGSDTLLIPINLGDIEVDGATSKTFTLTGQSFFQSIANGISVNSNVTKRNIKGMNLTITSGAAELYSYMLANKPSSSLSQNKPVYTNLSVNNNKKVIGLFSARYTKKIYYPFFKTIDSYYYLLNETTKKELNNGKYTTFNHKFCSQATNDIGKSFYCN